MPHKIEWLTIHERTKARTDPTVNTDDTWVVVEAILFGFKLASALWAFHFFLLELLHVDGLIILGWREVERLIEAGEGNVEAREFQLLELLDDQWHVPIGFVELIVSEAIGICLGRGEIYFRDRDGLKAKHGRREKPSVSYDDDVVLVYDNRLIKAKFLDGGSNFAYLGIRMQLGVAFVGLDVADGNLIGDHTLNVSSACTPFGLRGS